MQELYELRDMLCKELKEYGGKGELTPGSLEVIDKLAHATKNIDRIIETYEDEDGYSNRAYPMNGSYRYRGGSYRDGSRDRMGRYSNRYSRAGDLADQLHNLMHDAPNESIKREMQKLAEKIEQM